MNVFVLCTGRSGSVTFYNVCKHIKNYTTSHESRKNLDLVLSKSFAGLESHPQNPLNTVLSNKLTRYSI